ncbi:hypothetical protein ABDI30_11830 [Paenibacillus cisolokensis]|uniref:hypothetical protein n=1 Tax=Paenibacillus cisolokensis TaxID=1658519 RepID=UPI003D2A880B
MNRKVNEMLRRLELKLIRWRIEVGRIKVDPEVLPAALDWVNGEIAALENENAAYTG